MHVSPHTFRLLVFAWLAAACLLARCQELPTEPAAPDLDTHLPLAQPDTAFLQEDGTVLIDVLKNDASLVGDTLRLTQILQPPAHGTAGIEQARIRYTPTPNFNGQDTLTYQVTGALLAARGRVAFIVAPVNDRPEAVDDQFMIEETRGAPKILMADLDVLANDTDLDGDALVVFEVSNPATGTVSIAPGGGGIVYTPPAEFAGMVTFTYVVSDQQGGLDTAAVQVDVTAIDDVPVAGDDTYTVNEDEILTVLAPGILENDFDAEGQPLTLTLVDTTQNGTLALIASGAFSYTPNPNFSGTDGFTYTVSDGTQTSDVAKVTINIIEINDPPVAVNDTYTANAGETLIVQTPGILANDTDVENNPLSARQVGSVSNGMLDFRLDGSFIYTPNAGFIGDDQFTYRATDGLNSNVATVTLRIRAVNTPPVAVADTFTVLHDRVLAVPIPGVLINDTDAEADPLTANIVTGPTRGMLVLRLNGGFTYTPEANFAGTDTFTYRARDAANLSNPATVTLIVTNTPPIAEPDAYSVTQGDTLRVPAPGVIDNDRDDDGDAPLTSTLATPPGNGSVTLNPDGAFEYIPTPGFTGTDTFTYRITDGIDDSEPAMVTITVN